MFSKTQRNEWKRKRITITNKKKKPTIKTTHTHKNKEHKMQGYLVSVSF